MSRCSSRLLARAVGVFMITLQNKRVCRHYFLLISLSWLTSSVIHSSRWLAFIHSFLWWRSFTHFFLVPLLGLAITWLSFTQGIGLFISHHSHTLIIHQLVYISFTHSFVRDCLFVHSFVVHLFVHSFMRRCFGLSIHSFVAGQQFHSLISSMSYVR